MGGNPPLIHPLDYTMNHKSYRASFEICRNSEDVFVECKDRFLYRHRHISWGRSSEVYSTVVTFNEGIRAYVISCFFPA